MSLEEVAEVLPLPCSENASELVSKRHQIRRGQREVSPRPPGFTATLTLSIHNAIALVTTEKSHF